MEVDVNLPVGIEVEYIEFVIIYRGSVEFEL
jgi:hypothetical protein